MPIKDEPPIFVWPMLIRSGLSIAAFLGTVLYYIRWEDRWAQVHADEEFRLKRLSLDVDRASWLVEVLLEWRGAAGSEIPRELVDRLAGGLFESGKSSALAGHPVEEALASLLASPSSLRLKLPGGELNLDRKAIEKAREEASN